MNLILRAFDFCIQIYILIVFKAYKNNYIILKTIYYSA